MWIAPFDFGISLLPGVEPGRARAIVDRIRLNMLINAIEYPKKVTTKDGRRIKADKLTAQAQAYGFCQTDPAVSLSCTDTTIPFILPWQVGHFPAASYFDQNTAFAFMRCLHSGLRRCTASAFSEIGRAHV